VSGGSEASSANRYVCPARRGGYLAVHPDSNRWNRSRLRLKHHGGRCQVNKQAVVPIADVKSELSQLRRKCRVEPELPVPRFQAGVAAQQQVDRAGHGAEMDPLSGRAALEVGEVGV
jgi:hypothetical protein